MTSCSTLSRSTNAVLSAVHRTCNGPEAAKIARLYALVVPNCGAVIESFMQAKEVTK
jgi:hypothetical protein